MKWKVAIGIVLIAASIAGMYLWETRFRDEVTMTEVLVASENINVNEKLSEDDFASMRINPEAVIEGALTVQDAQDLLGKIAVYPVAARQQLLSSYFADEKDLAPEGFRHFVIPSDWIHSKSVIIGEKEYIRIYALPDPDDRLEDSEIQTTASAAEDKPFWQCPENYYLGSYRVAVLQPETELEILSTVDDYFKLYETVNFFGKKLLLVMEDE